MTSPTDILNKYISPGLILLNRYQIERVVGGGAYGTIYAAADMASQERVAIKALPPAQESSSKTAQGRFVREMKVISKITHPNIVQIYDYGQTPEGIPFMVLEYLQGQTLEREVHQRPMPLEIALEVTRQIASALAAAHAQGVIHRDLKPANIMVDRRPGHVTVKVLDFGMAKVLSQLDDESIVQLTREGVAVGTPRYIAPEQARGQQVGPWTDLYALGLLMYEMLTGARAVKANTIDAAVIAHVSPEPLHLDEAQMLPPVVHPILYKLIEKDPRKRYQSGQDLVQDIDRLTVSLRNPRHAQQAQQPRSVGEPEVRGPLSAVPASTLELDYDRVERADREAPVPTTLSMRAIKAPGAGHTPGRTLLQEPKRSKFIFVEWAIVILLTTFVYILWTAQFFKDAGYILRVTLSAVPFIATTLIGLFWVNRARWVNLPRLFMITLVIMFAAAHIDTKALITELIRDPAWFFKPFKELPGFDLLYKAASTMGREYAMFLSSLLRS